MATTTISSYNLRPTVKLTARAADISVAQHGSYKLWVMFKKWQHCRSETLRNMKMKQLNMATVSLPVLHTIHSVDGSEFIFTTVLAEHAWAVNALERFIENSFQPGRDDLIVSEFDEVDNEYMEGEVWGSMGMLIYKRGFDNKIICKVPALMHQRPLPLQDMDAWATNFKGFIEQYCAV